MQKGFFRTVYSSLLLLFIGISVIFLLFQYLLPGPEVNYTVLLFGNTLLFIIGILSVKMHVRALKHKSVQGFLQLVYGSFMMKFFILAMVAFTYIFINKKSINKPGLFGCLGLYILYAFLEVRTVMKMSKNKNA